MNGPSTSRSAWSTTGMLTAFVTVAPSRAATTCSATITPARSCASPVEAARCGVTTTCRARAAGLSTARPRRHRAPRPRASRTGSPRQRLLVDERSARGVDEPRAIAHQGDRVPIDEAARLVRQRRVERHDVGHCEQLVERLHLLDAEVAEPVAPDEGIEGDDVHRQPERAPCDLLPDPAEPDDAERLPGELDPAVARPLPAPLLERGVRLGDVAGERDEQADRLFRRGDDRRVGRVRDHDATPRGRLHVDVVDPDAGPSDHLQADSQLDHLARELRRGADHDRVVAVDDLLERRSRCRRRRRSGRGEARAAPRRWARGRGRASARGRDGAEGLERGRCRHDPARRLPRPRASSTSTAASASARSSIVTWPIWPMRNRRETRSPWPPAIVIPCRSRSASRSSTASMPSGVRAPVRTAALSSSGE